MECPFCGSLESKVIDSRDTPDHSMVRRRRVCLKCGKAFSTYEFALFKKSRGQSISASLFALPEDPRNLCAVLVGVCGSVGMTFLEAEKIVDDIIKTAKNKTPIYSHRYIDYLILLSLRKSKFAYFSAFLMYKYNIASPGLLEDLWNEGNNLKIEDINKLTENTGLTDLPNQYVKFTESSGKKGKKLTVSTKKAVTENQKNSAKELDKAYNRKPVKDKENNIININSGKPTKPENK
jgi:hypothetical protein